MREPEVILFDLDDTIVEFTWNQVFTWRMHASWRADRS
jgi:FMN phosphatase YigB (HAD superfamily)